eukprot:gene46571-43612_t
MAAAMAASVVLPLAAAAHGGVRLCEWGNSAMAGPPATTHTAPMNGSWPGRGGVLTVEWTGSVTPPASARYRFNCTFVGGYGLAWLQQDQARRTAGWGSWYAHNLLVVTRLPDAAQVRFGLCQLSTGACELQTVNAAQSARLGAHAADGSYAQLYHWWGGEKWDGG